MLICNGNGWLSDRVQEDRKETSMGYIFWMAVVVPVIFTGARLHCKMKEQKDKRWNLIPKCLPTWLMVCTAFAGIWQFQKREEDLWIFAAMILFLLADALLEIHFFLEMGVFAAGHLALIIWLLIQGHFTFAYVPVWVAGMLLMIWVFRKELERGKEDHRLYLMLLYPAVLMGMMAMAVCLSFTAGKSYGWIAVGSVLFVISDMMVGKKFFGKLPEKLEFGALILYYFGIFCISMMTWG